MEPFYVTTPIYYVNDVPHIGHAYTTIAADILARFHRMQGREVFFLTGTDEHGKKVEQAAVSQGKTARQMADEVHQRFVELWKILNISHDRFIRTTEVEHYEAVGNLWKAALANGDIYLGDYEGWYCTPCETFWTEKELIPEARSSEELIRGGTFRSGSLDPATGAMKVEHEELILLCPTCKRPTERLTQPSYFFKLSKHRQFLIDTLKSHPDLVQPPSRRNEVLGFLENEELKDLSISRTDFRWGIPVPGDDKHVIYVWFDALANYLTASHYSADRKPFWPASVHLVGKDILRFHTVYWFSFLKSAGLPLPKSVFAHGWWMVDGQKMSKSIGNVVDPFEVARTYGVDAFRYFLFREVPFGQDGNYSNRLMEARINGDLANDLGNLASRVISVAMQHFPDGVVREPLEHDPSKQGELGTLLIIKRERTKKAWQKAMTEIQFQKALDSAWELIREANGFVDRTRPWELKWKPEGNAVLIELLETLRYLSVYLQPFMPETSNNLGRQSTGADLFDRRSRPTSSPFNDLEARYPLLNGCRMEKGAHLFERIEIGARGERRKVKGEGPKMEDQNSTLSIDDFRKIEMRSAVILEAEDIPGSKKILKLKVDIGGETRQVVAGIKLSYPPADLVGKKVAVVTNLKPAKIMGVESQGMVLATGEESTQSLLSFDRDVQPGWKIK